MNYSIDGKLLGRNNKQNNIKNNEIKEDFINIPFFQFTSATNAGLRSTSNLTVDKDANIKGNVNLDGNLVSTSNLTVDKNANIKGNINLDGNLIKDEMEINFDKYWIQSDDQKNIYYNGNVGIGTTDPKNKLEVRGDVFLNNFSNNSYDRWGAKLFFDKGFDNKDRGDLKIDLYNKSGHYGFGVKGSTTAYYSRSMHRFLYGDATKTDVMMLKNGNVGIGTIDPKSILDIHVNDIYKGLSLTKADVKMVLGSIGGGNNSASIQVFRHVTNSTPSSSSVPYNLILQPNGGNVGIGNIGPQYILKVNTSKKYDGIVLFNSSKILAKMGKESNDSGYLNLYSSSSLKTSLNSKSGLNSFINNGGNVGIGNSKPAYKLDVNGDIRIPQKYAADGASSKLLFYSNPGFGAAGLNFVGGKLYNEQNSSYLNIFVRNTSVMAFQSGGNVGVGTTDPKNKLDVNGGLKAKSINPFTGNVSGTYYANFAKSGKHKYWHIIFGFTTNSAYNLQTLIDIEFSQHAMRYSTTGYHNRGGRCVGKVSLQIISDSPTNKENSGRSDGRYEVQIINNSDYTINGSRHNFSFWLLSYGEYYYLAASAGSSDSNNGSYNSCFKINIFDPYLKNVETFNSNHLLHPNYRYSNIGNTDPKFLKPSGSFIGDNKFGTGNYLFLSIGKKGNGNNKIFRVGDKNHDSV